MTQREPIAIVGVAAMFPGSPNAAEFWQNIIAGHDLISEVPAHYWLTEDYYSPDPTAPDKTYVNRGGFISPVAFDALEFGIPPASLPTTDSSQLLALLAAKEVLRDAAAGRSPHLPPDRIGIYLAQGVSWATLHMAARLQRPVWVKALRESGLPESEVQAACDRISAHYTPIRESTFPGILGNVVAGRVANRFNLGGANFVVDAACASSLAALSVAINDLYLGNADMVITGGVDALNEIQMFICFSKTPALSPTGDCRPFSSDADGTMLGEGIGFFALRRLSDAEKSGDRIYAVIRGLGASSDGRAKSIYAPRPEGQAVALERAYAAAGYTPDTVELLEAHGTGTKAGDAVEFEALKSVFLKNASRAGRSSGQWCALGSIKSQIGHTKLAAGSAGIFKAAMALHHKVLPPTIKIQRPNPAMGLEASPFYLNTEGRPWVSAGRHPRRASVSSFGFGGSNFHVALEEYSGPAPRHPRWALATGELVLLSGSRAEIAAACRKMSAANQTRPEIWRRLARESHVGFEAKAPARLAFVVSRQTDLETRLAAAIALCSSANAVAPRGLLFSETAHSARGSVAFVFSGQASQCVNMGRHLAMTFPFAQAVWDGAEATLSAAGFSPASLVFPPPVFDEASRLRQAESLTSTENAQPALAVQALAQLALLREVGVQADFAIGHSFGELVALHAAGVFKDDDLLLMARTRGELMSRMECHPGAMTAVSLPAEPLRELLRGEASTAVIANFNSPTQTVLSGATEAISALEERLRRDNTAFRRLPVSAAFHSPLVAAAAGPFRKMLDSVEMHPPAYPVLSNSDVQPYPANADAIRTRLAEQLTRPVHFLDQVEELYRRGTRIFIEVGMGNSLCSLIGRTLDGREHIAVSLERKDADGLTGMWEALGRLAVAGVTLDLAPLHSAFAAIPDVPENRAPGATFMIDGSLFGKPYPPPGGAAALPPPNPEKPASGTPKLETPGIPMPKPDLKPEQPSAPAPPPAMAPAAFAWTEIQQQIEAAQKATQQAILDTHALTLQSLERLALGHAGASPPAQPTLQPFQPATQPTRIPIYQASAQSPALPVQPAQMEAPRLIAVAAPVASAPPALNIPSQPDLPSANLADILLQVISEKTGYPVDVLDLDAELEAGLGIDSIKRVEIFSALEQRCSDLPQVSPEKMGSLRTLRQILSFLGDSAGPSPVSPAAMPVQPPDTPGGDSLGTLLLAVVAEKTGYPADVLDLDAELEAGLGIDSIKRVEIFSALQQRRADLPEVKPEHMGSLRTLRHVLSFLGESGAAPVVTAPPPPPPVIAKRESLGALLLQVVAEKTGYPVDVLDLDAELEAGLGIDSIKRVEIFSALQQRQSDLPEVKPEHMGSLRTLRQILTFLESSDDQGAAPVPAILSPALIREELRTVPAAAPGLPLTGLLSVDPLYVIDDGPEGIATRLVDAFRKQAIPAECVATLPAKARSLLIVTGFPPERAETGALAERHVEVLRMLKAIDSANRPLLIAVQSTASLDGIAAMVKTAAAEWPETAIKLIDVESSGRDRTHIAREIVNELLHGGDDREVGLRANGSRLAWELREAAATPGEPLTLGPESVLVVSGGARGVTAACLVALARESHPRFALLGTTPLDNAEFQIAGIRPETDELEIKRHLVEGAKRAGKPVELAAIARRAAGFKAVQEIQSTLDTLRTAGSEVMYLRADIGDPVAVSAALGSVRAQWGPITGFIHAAGTLADKLIADKTEEQFRRVLRVKVAGMDALLQATADDPLRLIACFSSVAARYGNAGQCDYAAANQVLNLKAAAEARRRGSACRVKSFVWGPWEGGMVSAALAQQFKARGAGLIPLTVGAEQFAREILSGDPAVQVQVTAPAGKPAGVAAVSACSVDILVNSRTYPMLSSHRIKELAVVPVVVAVEWLHRSAHFRFSGMQVSACHDLRVLRGIVLPEYEAGGRQLRVELTPDGETFLSAELRSPSGETHYSARLELTPRLKGTNGNGHKNGASPFLLRDDVKPYYEGPLFHGPEFQVIHSIEKMDSEGATAILAGTDAMGWSAGPWHTDAAAIDGALQVLRLWSVQFLGRPSLPAKIGSFVNHAVPPHGLLRCTLRCTALGKLGAVSDIQIQAADGSPVVDLNRVEVFVTAE